MRILEKEELLQIAGGGDTSQNSCKKGNNGFGNGGDDGVPGTSGDNPAPNADQKADDVVR